MRHVGAMLERARSSRGVCCSRQRQLVVLGAVKPAGASGRSVRGCRTGEGPPARGDAPLQHPAKRAASAAAAALCAAALVLSPTPAVDAATNALEVGGCVLAKCQSALAACVADGPCLQNLVCLNSCNGDPDEIGCQIRCGDRYGDAAVDTFNTCALSEQKCVPQRVDEGLFPVPPDCALDSAFDLSGFTGRWYITAGLNPLFDTFDCQEHYFRVPEIGRLEAQINWRIAKPRGDFLERTTLQEFVQDASKPAILVNHDNEYLHYEDDWYILGSKPDSYVFVYYKGNNDAWRGYGGAVVYTRAAALPPDIVPELREAAAGAGLKWDDFMLTDNTCGPRPPQRALLQEVTSEVAALEAAAEDQLRSFGRGFTVLEGRLADELAAEEATLAREVAAFERALMLDQLGDAWGELVSRVRGLVGGGGGGGGSSGSGGVGGRGM